MTIPELIEILKAAEDGKVIESKMPTLPNGTWVQIFKPELEVIIRRLSAGYELRVRHEPRDFWTVLRGLYSSEEDARKYNPGKVILHVREVLP